MLTDCQKVLIEANKHFSVFNGLPFWTGATRALAIKVQIDGWGVAEQFNNWISPPGPKCFDRGQDNMGDDVLPGCSCNFFLDIEAKVIYTQHKQHQKIWAILR
jgi:hypothetical protein